MDVSTETETVALMEDFILDIYCPRGSAVTFKVSMCIVTLIRIEILVKQQNFDM